MEWDALILSLVGFYCGFKCFNYAEGSDRLKFLGLSIAAFVFAATQLSVVIDGGLDHLGLTLYSGIVVEWGHIITLAFILSALAVFIRQSKPVFAQFPLVYAALPLFIVLSYFLVANTYALKDWLLSIYQGGAIIVALLMYSVYTYREQRYMYILGGIILFLITFLMYWYVPGVSENISWAWKTSLVGSLLLTLYGYDYARKKNPSGNENIHI
ncbi:MAG: hypothetical protein R3345_14440 [Fulvivirga sp.]|nr:hypothetical protein [Fulvivirga sp.]